LISSISASNFFFFKLNLYIANSELINMGMENYIRILSGRKDIQVNELINLAKALFEAEIIKEPDTCTGQPFIIEKKSYYLRLNESDQFLKKIETAIKSDDVLKRGAYFQWIRFCFQDYPLFLRQYDQDHKEYDQEIKMPGFFIEISVKKLWADPVKVIKLLKEAVVPIFEKTLKVKAQVEYNISY